ncbi:NADH-quinone oxidoreductase subunit C [Bacillota bacterium Lsc_1132]
MSGEKDLDQLKKEAAEKAKAAALAKRQTKQVGEAAAKSEENPKEMNHVADSGAGDDLAKKKAAAAAKAKAAAMAKIKAAGETAQAQEKTPEPEQQEPDKAGKSLDIAKKKAAAAAKAKAAAAAKQARESGTSEPAEVTEASEADGADAKAKAAAAAKAKVKAAAAAKAKAAATAKQAGTTAASDGDDEKAKAIAAAKAKAKAAAAAKAKAAGKTGAETAKPALETKPSPNQQYLDKYLKVIEENLGSDILEDSYINNLSKHVPTLVAKRDTYFKLAQFLKYNELLGFDYLSELHGTDYETHMELYVHLYSYKNRQSVALKVKLDRDEPTIDSLQPVWAGANWPECEAYDLLGIKFTGHPKLYRILLGDDWIGHPLRKDYEPYDVEV